MGNTENNVFILNKQALMSAAQELEKQDALQSLMLFLCLEQIEDIRRKLDVILTRNETSRARDAFLELFLNKEEWHRLLGDESEFEQWKAEAQTAYSAL